MPKIQVLLVGVVGIFISVGLVYAVVAHRYQSPEGYTDEDVVSEVGTKESVSDGELQQLITQETPRAEEGVSITETGSLPATQQITNTQPAAKPTTVQTETQTPSVPPAPVPSAKEGYTLAEVATHSTKASCWTTVNGKVYDLTSYVPRHPGGEKNILKICGKDGTALFEDQHGGESKPESRLASLYIGMLIE